MLPSSLVTRMFKLAHTRRIAELEILCDRLGLGEYYDIACNENPSRDLGYHNTTHQQYVALTAFQLYTIGQINCGITMPEAQALVLAGLFHDFGHSGGHKTDAENIEVAVAGLKDAAERVSVSSAADSWVIINACKLIRATEYPDKGELHHPLQSYLIDADFLWTSELAAGKVVMEGLPIEIAVRTGKVLSPIEMIDTQAKFLPTVKMGSLVGESIWNVIIPDTNRFQEAYALYVEGVRPTAIEDSLNDPGDTDDIGGLHRSCLTPTGKTPVSLIADVVADMMMNEVMTAASRVNAPVRASLIQVNPVYSSQLPQLPSEGHFDIRDPSKQSGEPQ